MIRLDAVHKSFGAVHAVRGVSLDIPRGQVVGILGPNGAGKTTTVRMITGAIPPSSGTVSVDGLDSVARTMDVRRCLGYLPEAAPLYREMRVGDYLTYRGALFGMRGAAGRRAIDAAVERCSLAPVMRQRTGTLSKGFRQRVGLASVLLHDPKVLILDEPTSGLDPAQIAEVRALIRDLAGERTMLIVSHILPEVERSCDRIIVFARGKVRADGKPEDLVRGISPATGGYLVEARQEPEGGPNPAAVLASIAGARVIKDEPAGGGWRALRIAFEGGSQHADMREAIARAAADARLLVRELHRPGGGATLEDLYLRIITQEDEGGEP
jgi:ABC-2 type transport system ATP-binding protein